MAVQAQQVGARKKELPNVIWLDLEDIGPIMEVYGDSTVRTPNISRLAKEGVTFMRAYSCAGVCAPSRASIITGMYPTAIGAHNMRVTSTNRDLAGRYEVVPPPEVRCFPDLLRERGVYTVCSKKTDYQFRPSPLTWDEFARNDEVDRYEFPKATPFFKQINFWETHESQIFDWMRRNVPLRVDTSKVKVPPYLPQSPTTRLDWATQYNNLLAVDEKIGRLLSALEKEKLLDKTVIIFTGDHGNGLPRSKRTVYESGVRVPLIIRFPDGRMAGSRNDNLVYLMDLGPTILSFYNIPVPDYMHGRNVFDNTLPPRSFVFLAADRFDDQTDIIRAVSDGRYKYIRNLQPHKPQFLEIDFRKKQEGVRELYELEKAGKLNELQQAVMRKSKPVEEFFALATDPHEINNVAALPEHQARLIAFRAALDEWMRMTGDLGFTPEEELKQRFWPDNLQPVTTSPSVDKANGRVTLTCTTPGASIGYKRKFEDPYSIYTGPVTVKKGEVLYVIAHRLGYKTSDVVVVK